MYGGGISLNISMFGAERQTFLKMEDSRSLNMATSKSYLPSLERSVSSFREPCMHFLRCDLTDEVKEQNC